MAVSKPDFTRQFGSAKADLTPVSNANYAQGWDFVGSTPPSKNDFTYLQNLADQRLIWLYENYNAGRLLGVKVMTTTGTYTKSEGCNRIIVRMVGGGGAGGGTAPTSASQIASGVGGNAGTYSESGIIDVTTITSVPVTVGSSGQPIAGATGGNGGASSFGGFLIAPGGAGGGVGSAGGAGTAGPDQGPGTPGSGSAISFTIPGSGGTGPFNVSIVSAGTKGGKGGDSVYGMGGGGINGTLTPRAGSGYGAGGGANAAGPGAASAIAGGAGSGGIVIIEEYY